jgi:nicotinate phosphoribosyltransferase
MTFARPRSRRTRLDPEIFDLPVEKMRDGYYSDAYFNHTRAALLYDGRRPRVVMQVFQKRQAMLGGMDEAIAIIELCSYDWSGLTVHALRDGDRVEPWETVMTIEGDYTTFAHLETVVLGTLARRTLIATNTARVLEAADGKPIIFMPARHDHHRVQTGDGYAAYVAGAVLGTEIGVTSDAQASWWGGRGVGTVPHSLIAAYGGNTVLAATKFADWAPEDFRITVLVDYDNDSVRTALDVARALGPRLWGCASTRRASSSIVRSGRRWATSIHAASTSDSYARCARHSTKTVSSASGSSRRAASRSRRSSRSSVLACPSTRTASARR